MKVVIAGCGYVGCALGARLVAEGHTVFGVRRRPAALPGGIRPLAADLTDAASLRALPAEPDAVVYAAAAGLRDEASYRAVYLDGVHNVLRALRPRRFVFVSSTAVYEQTDGSWVDEGTPVVPQGFRGRVQQAAEAALEGAVETGVAVRFGGIYGPGRGRLLEAVRGGSARWRRDRYTNRIHRDDCAGVLAHLLSLESPAPLYLGVDSDPAPEREVYRWLAERLGLPAPPEDMDAGPGASKRCSNARLLASGYRLSYPSFRDGYAELLPGGTR